MRRRIPMKTTVFRAFCAVSLLLSWACNSDRTARNEDNAYFTQAVEFQEQQQYAAAAEAFSCLNEYVNAHYRTHTERDL